MAYAHTLYQKNFLEYASYVIKDRAIPHLDDGLKPVQRRIIHSLLEMDDGKFHKVANVVGHCMKYHPHGDASIYSALVVLANKNLFIDRQGNFGNIYTGDEASAARYIECRLLPFAREVLYNKALTDYEASYDGRNREPITFPAKIPVVLALGAEGIAVGMATKILPHNLIEIMAALQAELRGEEYELFPDFETGGFCDVRQYNDGQGKVMVRAKLDLQDPRRIVIRELPFGTTTESLVNSIEQASRKNLIKVAQINDYTAEQVEIEIVMPRGVKNSEIVDALYAFTDCEQSISVNLLVIHDGKPLEMTVSGVISYHAQRLLYLLNKELEHQKMELEDKLHARTLERIFIEERIYKKIESQDTAAKVLSAVHKGLKPYAGEIKRTVTDEDVERLLKIPIRRISLYDINKAKKEMEEIKGQLAEIVHHLAHIVEYGIGYLQKLIDSQKKLFPRKTQLGTFEKTEAKEAAIRTINMRYDGETGYIGTKVLSGKVLYNVSALDRILIIRKTGLYSVVPAPDRLFVDVDMLHSSVADKDEMAERIFTVAYRHPERSGVYIKRFPIEKYILEKVYSLFPEGGELLLFTEQQKGTVTIETKPVGRRKTGDKTRITLDEIPVKAATVLGTRVVAKDAKEVSIK